MKKLVLMENVFRDVIRRIHVPTFHVRLLNTAKQDDVSILMLATLTAQKEQPAIALAYSMLKILVKASSAQKTNFVSTENV